MAKSLYFSGSGSMGILPRIVRDPTWEAALAGALHRAALAAPYGLQLQSFIGWASSSVVLRALPASKLTYLHLDDLNAVPNSTVADVVAGIAGLTALQHLALYGSNSTGNSRRTCSVEAYLPALPALSKLTSLTLSGKLDWQLLQIPALPQLRNLQLIAPPAPRQLRREQALQLGHLSSVTALNLFSIAVQEKDELPPQLQKLYSWDVSSTEPLCSLRQLHTLDIAGASTAAAQLQQLGQSARSLRSVVLKFNTAQDACNSAAGWPALPLQALRVDVHGFCCMVRRTTLQCISRLQGLTGLQLHGCVFGQTAEWQLAEVLLQLTGLQSLGLHYLDFKEDLGEEEEEDAEEGWEAANEAGQQQQQQPGDAAAAGVGPVLPAAAQQPAAGVPAAAGADAGPGHAAAEQAAAPDLLGWPAILRAAAHLPQLRELSLNVPLDAAAVAQLAGATQLQDLLLVHPWAVDRQHDSPSEPVLVDLLCCLTGLRTLNLNDQPHLSDTAMPVIGRLLTQLTHLSIDNSLITDAGLAYLTGLRQLESVSVMGTAVTRSAARAVLPDVIVLVEP
jgi:hypothetical protein